MKYPFYTRLRRQLAARVSRTMIITGNVVDHLFLDDEYLPLGDYLTAKWCSPGFITIRMTVGGRLRVSGNEMDEDVVKEKLRNAWVGYFLQRLSAEIGFSDREKETYDNACGLFDGYYAKSVENPAVAIELLRQLCAASRAEFRGRKLLDKSLVILIEGAEFLLPDQSVMSLDASKERCIKTVAEWFSDPDFMSSTDAVVLVSESRSMIHRKVSALPQLLEVKVPSPQVDERTDYIRWFNAQQPDGRKIKLWSKGTQRELAELTAGLTLLELRQLLQDSVYDKHALSKDAVIAKVEQFIQTQLGEGVVEFKKPGHTLKDVVGNRVLKEFLARRVIPRIKKRGKAGISGCAVCGPIGGGKTFLWEAVAAELGMVVLVLKSIRSKWFGETDVIFERLERVISALGKVLIFVDEADTQFGGLGEEAHDTEKRLTGKIQAMMSDVKLRGQVIWLLMTARIHRLSPDILRPGRAGDFIIPVLDPDGLDQKDFLRWAVTEFSEKLAEDELSRLDGLTGDFSAAGYAALRSMLAAEERTLTFEEVLAVIEDYLPLEQGDVRRYQTLQALCHCTSKFLIEPVIGEKNYLDCKEAWRNEIRQLEQKGVA